MGTGRKIHFTELDENGYLAISSFDQNKDINYNAWNIDLNFNYWFAPGSEISVLKTLSTEAPFYQLTIETI